MNINDPSLLVRLFDGHGISAEVENSWVVPNGELPAIGMNWDGKFSEHAGSLNVSVVFDSNVILTESFAGMGDTDATRQKDALNNFLQSSYHVLLGAYWNFVDPDQIVVEDWEIQGEPWKAYIGNYVNRGTGDNNPTVPEGAFDKLQNAVERTVLDADSHWFRTYFCNVAGEHIYEALNNNHHWSNGEKCLRDLPWAASDSFYSVRHFMVLRHCTVGA